MKVKIEIDTMTFVRLLLVATGFVAVIAMIWHLRTPLTIVFLAFFLALALNPPVTKLARKLPGESRIGATALAYVVVLAVIGGFLVLAIPPAVQQTTAFAQNVPEYIESLRDQDGPVRGFLQRYGLEAQLDDAIENAKSRVAELAQGVGSAFITGVGTVLNGFVILITILVLTFLMLIEGPKWMERLWALYVDDAKRERHHALVHRMYRVVTGYVNGQVLVAGIAASGALTVILILSAVFDVPFSASLPLAGIVFLTGMIPMIGATLGAVIVTVALLFSDVTAALVFVAYFIVYQQIENNLIQPVVQARSVELTALTVFTAVIIGISLMGIVGGIVAIPVAGVLRVLLDHYITQRRKHAAIHPENVVRRIAKVAKNVAKS